jgi:hypothetical protein
MVCRCCDSSGVFSLCATFGSESFWLEHAFFLDHFKLPRVCFFLAFRHLNGFTPFAFKSSFGNALIKGGIEKPS